MEGPMTEEVFDFGVEHKSLGLALIYYMHTYMMVE